MRKFKLLPLMVLTIVVVGCSSGSLTSPANDGSPILKGITASGTNHWQWGAWVFAVNDDHTKIEQVPLRDMNLHLNVTKFVEGPPCPNCLEFGQVKPEADGTFTIDITLRHPFPGQKEYTGFDVRGTVVFPATHHWYHQGVFLWEPNTIKQIYPTVPGVPVFFSHSSAGGAMVLNPTGYSFYLFPDFIPGTGYDNPINKYYKGKHATETEDLDSTVNPFIEFHSDQPRWMFLPGTVVTRTYHIKPLEGAFKFGYIVDASWAPPNVLPVSDPAVDFPDYANAEDPITVQFEQIAPLQNNKVGYDATDWILRHRKGEKIGGVEIISNALQLVDPPDAPWPIILESWTGVGSPNVYPIDEYTDETIESVCVYHGGFTGNPPGKYVAVAIASVEKAQPDGYDPESAYYGGTFGYQIVELELVE